MQETEGGIVVTLLVIGACLLLGGCVATRKVGEVTHDPCASDSTSTP